MLEAVIFDMDGVIIDSEPFFIEAENQLLKKYGHEVPLDYHYQFQGTTHDYMWGIMKEKYKLPTSVKNLVNEANIMRENLIEEKGMKTIPHVLEFIEHLSIEDLPLAIASSSPKNDIENTIESFNLENKLEYYISGNEVANSKPAPDIFLKAAEELGMEPENCLIIEDSSNGVKAGAAAGMKVIGYRNPNFPPQDLSKADKIITDFKGLNKKDLTELFN